MTPEPDFTKGAAIFGGKLLPTNQAALPVTDWGLTHSDITYDVVHVWDGRFFRLNDYLDRFEASMAALRLNIPEGRDDIRRTLHTIVARSGLRRAYVSFVASRGQPSIPSSRDPRDCANHFYAWCVPFIWVFDGTVRARGAHLQTPAQTRRIAAHAVDPTAKNYHWGDFTNGLFEAKEAGFDSTLLLDDNGCINEGPGFNVFIVKDGRLTTPGRGVLEGITRKTVIEIGNAMGLSTELRDIPLAEALDADEVFATTSGGGPVPVTRINDRVFSNSAPGPLTRQLEATYWAWHDDPAMSEAVNYDLD